MHQINFTAARARVLKLVAAHTTYVDIEFTADELAAYERLTVADMLRECVDAVGARGVRQELVRGAK